MVRHLDYHCSTLSTWMTGREDRAPREKLRRGVSLVLFYSFDFLIGIIGKDITFCPMKETKVMRESDVCS